MNTALLPDATLRLETYQSTRREQPIGFHVLVRGKVVAVLSLGDFRRAGAALQAVEAFNLQHLVR